MSSGNLQTKQPVRNNSTEFMSSGKNPHMIDTIIFNTPFKHVNVDEPKHAIEELEEGEGENSIAHKINIEQELKEELHELEKEEEEEKEEEKEEDLNIIQRI